MTKKKRITLAKRFRTKGEKDLEFASIKEASEFLGVSRNQFSRMMRGLTSNTSPYYISYD